MGSRRIDDTASRSNSRKGRIAIEQRYITPAEAAEILRVTRRTVYAWLRAGKLEAVQVQGCWRIPARAVEVRERKQASLAWVADKFYSGVPKSG